MLLFNVADILIIYCMVLEIVTKGLITVLIKYDFNNVFRYCPLCKNDTSQVRQMKK